VGCLDRQARSPTASGLGDPRARRLVAKLEIETRQDKRSALHAMTVAEDHRFVRDVQHRTSRSLGGVDQPRWETLETSLDRDRCKRPRTVTEVRGSTAGRASRRGRVARILKIRPRRSPSPRSAPPDRLATRIAEIRADAQRQARTSTIYWAAYRVGYWWSGLIALVNCPVRPGASIMGAGVPRRS
jgi:hypothetical protein